MCFFECSGTDRRPRAIRRYAGWLVALFLAVSPATAQSSPPGSTGDADKIFLRGRVIDTTAPPEPVPQAFTRAPTTGDQLYLIQFSGPIQDEWLEKVRALGKVEVVTYLPTHAYLIWTDGPTVEKLQQLSRQRGGFVQWTGPYQPAYGVHPDLARAAAATPEDRAVTVQLVDHEGVDVSIAAIKARAKEVLRDAWNVGPYRNLRIVVSSEDLDDIAALADVVNVEPFLEPHPVGERQGQILAGQLNAAGSQPAGPGYLAWLAARGFVANFGFTVDVTDSGLDRGQTAAASLHQDFLDGGGASRVTYVQEVVGAVISTAAADNLDQDGHGTINASIVAGFNNSGGAAFQDAAGFRYGLGIAPFARVGSSRIFNPGWTNPDFTELINAAYANGARINNNSWGSSCFGGCCPAGLLGAYDAASQEYDGLVRDARPAGASDGGQAGNQEMVIVFSAGNNGGCPNEDLGNNGSTAKNTLVVGAGENFNQAGLDGCAQTNADADDARDIIDFSSRGPAQDLRVKPDLMGPGTHVAGVASQDPSFNGDGVCGDATNSPGNGVSGPGDFFPLGQTLYTWSSGTSHSAPAVAGGAALVRQWFLNQGEPAPSPAMTKAYLMSSATWMTGVGANDTLPSNNQGMGRMDLGRSFDAVPRLLVDQTHTFDSSGETWVTTGTIPDATQPFRVTLAWTDAPGPTIGNAWVNNLDLEVAVDDGAASTLYLGNVFLNAQSQPGGAADFRNNVESVWLPAGTTGDFTVTVRATNVAGDGVPNSGDATDQDFALVVYNAVELEPQIQIPGPLDFGDVCVGATATATLDVCNTGDADLVVDPIVSSDAQFSVTAPSGGYPVTIGPAFCFPFQVQLTPAAAGPQAATLTVPSNDPNTPSTNVQASGNGTEQDVQVTGSTDFGVASAWSPAEKTVTVCNVGGCDLSVVSAAIGCADFTLVSNPFPASLPAAACLDVVVGFTPVLPGAKSCQLTITSDDPDTPVLNRTLTARTPPLFSLHAGLATAHGALAAVADDGSTLNLDVVVPVTPQLAWDVRLGVSKLDGQPAQPDVDVFALSSNVRFTFNPAAPVRIFINGGPGLYHFDPGDFEAGINAGLGLSVPVGPRFAFEATYNYHVAFTAAPDLEYDQIQLGLLVSF